MHHGYVAKCKCNRIFKHSGKDIEPEFAYNSTTTSALVFGIPTLPDELQWCHLRLLVDSHGYTDLELGFIGL